METTVSPNRFTYLGGTCVEPGCECTDRTTCNALGHASITEPCGNSSPARPLGERVYEAIAKHLEGADPMILMIIGSYAETIKGLEDAPLRESLKQLRAAIDELLYR